MRAYLMSDFHGRDERRPYATRASAERYAKSHGLTVVDSWPANDPPPATGDARAWDDWRLRGGISGSHH